MNKITQEIALNCISQGYTDFFSLLEAYEIITEDFIHDDKMQSKGKENRKAVQAKRCL